jgi:hypothetical protein
VVKVKPGQLARLDLPGQREQLVQQGQRVLLELQVLLARPGQLDHKDLQAHKVHKDLLE